MEITNNIDSNIRSIIIHKQLILGSCYKMAQYLVSCGKHDLALQIIKRGSVHDNSQINISKLMKDNKFLKDFFTKPDRPLKRSEKIKLKKHWLKKNDSRPQLNSFSEMSLLDKIEMVCDWYARCLQYCISLKEFIYKSQVSLFKFPKKFLNEVLNYSNVLENY